MLAAGQLDGPVDTVAGQLFETRALGAGVLEGRRILGGDALAEGLPVLPNLVLEVRAGGRLPGRDETRP